MTPGTRAFRSRPARCERLAGPARRLSLDLDPVASDHDRSRRSQPERRIRALDRIRGAWTGDRNRCDDLGHRSLREEVEEARDRLLRRDRNGAVLPARTDLVAAERLVAPVQGAEPDPRCYRPAEVAARPTARRRPVADPAARRLGLGRRTRWAPPGRHDQMVATNQAVVTANRMAIERAVYRNGRSIGG